MRTLTLTLLIALTACAGGAFALDQEAGGRLLPVVPAGEFGDAGAFLFAQWRPLRGAVQPYAEAQVGVDYLWTESKLQDEDWWDDDQVARKTNYDVFATVWGGAGGLLIRLSNGNKAEKKPGVVLTF